MLNAVLEYFVALEEAVSANRDGLCYYRFLDVYLPWASQNLPKLTCVLPSISHETMQSILRKIHSLYALKGNPAKKTKLTCYRSGVGSIVSDIRYDPNEHVTLYRHELRRDLKMRLRELTVSHSLL